MKWIIDRLKKYHANFERNSIFFVLKKIFVKNVIVFFLNMVIHKILEHDFSKYLSFLINVIKIQETLSYKLIVYVDWFVIKNCS